MINKKIALVGNNGNWNFALLRLLRERGFNTYLLIFKQTWNPFNPFNDCFTLEWHKYIIYIKECQYPPSKDEVSHLKIILQEFDFFIFNGPESYFVNFCDIHADIYIPYGHDIHFHPWQPREFNLLKKLFYLLSPKRDYRNVKFGTWDKQITETFKAASNIIFEKTNTEMEKQFDQINTNGKRWNLTPPFLYMKEFLNDQNEFTSSDIHWKSVIDKVRQEYDFILMYGTRQDWIDPDNIPHKGSDKLIRGYSKFLKKKDKNYKCILILQESGKDLNASKNLIAELNIQDYVLWIPTMARKDIMYFYYNSDLCAGQFHQSFLTYGTIVDAMAIGKPIITYRKDSLYTNYYDSLYPILNAQSPLEISEQLLANYKDNDKLKNIGLQAQKWVNKNLIEKPLNKIIEIILEKP